MKKILLSIFALASYSISFGQIGQYYTPVVKNSDFTITSPNAALSNYFTNWEIATGPTFTNYDTTFINQPNSNYPVSGKAVGLKTISGNGETSISSLSQVIDFSNQPVGSILQAPKYLVGAYDYQSSDPNDKFEVIVNGFIGGFVINSTISVAKGSGVFNLPIVGTPCSGKSCNAPTYLRVAITSCNNCVPQGPERIATIAGLRNYLIVDEVKFSETQIHTPVGLEDEANNALTFYPNPVNDILFVDSFTEIYNYQGVKVAEGFDAINLNGQSAGLYFLKSKNKTYKIFKN